MKWIHALTVFQLQEASLNFQEFISSKIHYNSTLSVPAETRKSKFQSMASEWIVIKLADYRTWEIAARQRTLQSRSSRVVIKVIAWAESQLKDRRWRWFPLLTLRLQIPAFCWFITVIVRKMRKRENLMPSKWSLMLRVIRVQVSFVGGDSEEPER